MPRYSELQGRAPGNSVRLESTTSLGVNRPPKRYPNRSRPDRENAKAEASKRILSSSAFLIPRERTRWGQARMARSLTSRHSGQASCLSDLGRSVYPNDLKMIDVSLSEVRSSVGNGPVLIRCSFNPGGRNVSSPHKFSFSKRPLCVPSI